MSETTARGYAANSVSQELHVDSGEDTGLDLGADISSSGRTSPERAIGGVTRGVSNFASVGQHYYTTFALRLWKGPVTGTVAIALGGADHAAPKTTPDGHRLCVPVAAACLRGTGVTDIVTNHSEAADHTASVGQHSYTTGEDTLRLREHSAPACLRGEAVSSQTL
ncbi:hypothetical protein CALVIDRAFT_287627 [Calocera viscosa TUFC12733]|uniref:Uncharacterized protein n=1 Tax=Calocera viscosa (strain TUFC12733) TaxID=1330018 RepID=A0A167IW84_CALVF|nr:hypothetical protein CALVIDRAFT_287627 [Calocera viscosa TUFC12733]